jgi:hypothetical protein
VGVLPENSEQPWPPSVLFIWDVSALRKMAEKEFKMPGQDVWPLLFREPTWMSDLAFEAMISLVNHPRDAVPWIKGQLGPPLDRERILRLIQDLDSDDFPTRAKASAGLEQMGPFVAPALEEAQQKKPSLEGQRRLEQILSTVKPTAAVHEVRLCRTIDVLEHIGTTEALDLLRSFAQGDYGEPVANSARDALQRIEKK